MYKGITKEAPSLLFFFTLNPLNMRRKRSQIQHWEMHEHNPVTHVKAKVQLKQDVACKYFHGNCFKRAKILCYNWFFLKFNLFSDCIVLQCYAAANWIENSTHYYYRVFPALGHAYIFGKHFGFSIEATNAHVTNKDRTLFLETLRCFLKHFLEPFWWWDWWQQWRRVKCNKCSNFCLFWKHHLPPLRHQFAS